MSILNNLKPSYYMSNVAVCLKFFIIIFLLFEFCCGTPPSCLKVRVGGGGGLQHFSVSPRPLGFLVFGFGGLGFGARA